MRYLHTLPLYLAKLSAFGDIPKLSFAFLVAAITYVFPGPDVQATILTVFGFIALDTSTALVALRVRKRKWRSRSFGRILVKVFGYVTVAGVASITARELMPSAPQAREVLVRFVLWACLLTEAKSILENVQKMGVTVPPWLLKIIRDRAKQIADDATATIAKPTDDQPAED